MYHAFLPSLHDYDVKMPNYMFYGGREQGKLLFLSLSKLDCSPQEINSRKYSFTDVFSEVLTITATFHQILGTPFRGRIS